MRSSADSSSRQHLGEKTAGWIITFHVTALNSFFEDFLKVRSRFFFILFFNFVPVWVSEAPPGADSEFDDLISLVSVLKCCRGGGSHSRVLWLVSAGESAARRWRNVRSSVSSELTTRCCTGGRRICSTCPELRRSDRHTAAAETEVRTHTFHPLIVHEWMWTCVEVCQWLKWDELSHLCLVFLL